MEIKKTNYCYDPYILGFTRKYGSIMIKLQSARENYGKYPSDYNLVNNNKIRKAQKSLNLKTGIKIINILKQEANKDYTKEKKFKEIFYDFYQKWHRNYLKEFGIDTRALFSLNDYKYLTYIININKNILNNLLKTDIRNRLKQTKLIRKEILNSINDSILLLKALEILNKKIKKSQNIKKRQEIKQEIFFLKARIAIEKLIRITGNNFSEYKKILVYTDEISKILYECSQYINLKGINNLEVIRGKGVEFEYANRDMSYFKLGKETRDCTANISYFQADADVENIYWTVFAWILDYNYQILKVYYNGKFIAKVHLLPLFLFDENNQYIFLSVDAIETITKFRDDMKGGGDKELLNNKEHIFSEIIKKIESIAYKMNIKYIYAEKFSNTKWVREALEKMHKININVNHIHKIDHLEDVCELANILCGENEIFMEIQTTNTSLLTNFVLSNIKSFSIIKGN